MRGGLLLVAAVLAALAAAAAHGAPAAPKGACRLLFLEDLQTALHDTGSIYARIPAKARPTPQIPGVRRFHGTEYSCLFFGRGSTEQVWLVISVFPTRAEAARYYAHSEGRFCAKGDRISFGPHGCGSAGGLAASSGRFYLHLSGDLHDGSAMDIQALEQLAKDVFATAPRYY